MRALLLIVVLAIAAVTAWYVIDSGGVAPVVGGGQETETGRADEQSGGPVAGKTRDPEAGREAVAATPSATKSAPKVVGRLVHADGTPVAGAKLEIRADLGLTDSGVPIPVPRELRDTAEKVAGATDVDGRFELPVAGKKRYRLHVLEEGVVLSGKSRHGHRFRVQAEDVDLGDVPTLQAATIRGQVVHGGRGVEGVELALGQTAGFGILGGGLTKTDENGRFTLASVHPGKVKLSTRSPSFLPATKDLEVQAGQQVSDLVIELQVGGVIAGTVVDDLGVPVADANVSAARHRQLGPGMTYKGFQSGESTKTDASGRFRIAGLAQETVQLRASKTGHAAGELQGLAVGRSDVRIKIDRLGVIRGVLVDEKGTAIAGSEIAASVPRSGPMMVMPSAGDLRTDEQGRFEIEGVQPGRNRVVATGKAHLEASADVAVAAGQTVTGVKLVARRGTTLTVQVRDHAGQPVANAKVTVAQRAPRRGGGMRTSSRRIERRIRSGSRGGRSVVIDSNSPQSLGSATTNDEGIAIVKGLPAGAAEVKADHAALALANPASVDLPDGGDAECQLEMQLGGFVDIVVVDGQGEPLPGAKFEVSGPNGAAEDTPRISQVANAEGQARVGPLRPGAYEAVLAQKPKARRIGENMSFSMLGDQTTLQDSKQLFEVKPERSSSVRLVMPVLTTVRGIVRDANGPVTGAEVDLTAEGQVRMPMMGQNRVRTDAEGRFEIPAMPSGKYTLSYGLRGAVVPSEKEIVLATNQPLHEEDLTLPGGVIKLQVKDAGEGFGIEDATVSLQKAQPKAAPGAAPRPRRTARIMMVGMTAGGSGGPSTFQMTSGGEGITTDGEGRAEIRGVPPGTYDLRIKHADYAKVHRVVVMGTDQSRDLGVIQVAEGCKIRGKLDWKNPPPNFALASVEIAKADGSDPETEMSQHLRFKFEGLAPGTYRLRARPVSAQNWGPPKTVEVRPGQTERVTLEIPSK